VKGEFKHTNNHADAALQVLVKEKRRDTLRLVTPSSITLDGSDDDEMLNGVAQEAAKRAGCAASTAQTLSRVNASFRDSVHCSARHYPVAQAIQEHKMCTRVLCMQTVHKHRASACGRQSQAQVVLRWQTLLDRTSLWQQGCAEIDQLPKYLAAYIRDRYPSAMPSHFPAAGDRPLNWEEISTLCNLLQEKDPRRGQHGHLAVYNALEISHCKIPSRMVLRAHPFKHLPYHGKNRQDYAAWRPNYIDIPRDDYDPSDPQHPVAYVRLIMLFKCGICPAQGVSEEEHSLAFVEELWPYTPPREDILQSKYECDMLYTTKPTPAYYVVNINSLLGTAAIMKHPCTPTIPHDGLRGVRNKNPNASADTSPGDGTGSALFRLNAWCMQWGQRYAVTRP
jgi:hypothetical protein